MLRTFGNIKNRLLNYLHLPYYVLGFVYIVKVLILFVVKPVYEFDEVILTQISKQAPTKLLDSVSVDPHPPGFYFLLKFFPVENVLYSKLLILTLSFALFVLVIVYVYRSFTRPRALMIGLALFFASYSFFSIPSVLKQDSLSLPILLMIFFMALKFVESRKVRREEITLINLLSLILLFLGYVNYLYAVLIIAATFFVFKKDKYGQKLIFLQLLVFGLYIYLFGFTQLINNTQRFSLVSEIPNSIISSLNFHLTGFTKFNFWSDSVLFAIFGFIFYFVSNTKKAKLKGVSTAFIVLLVCLIISLGYLAKLYVRVRYIVFLYFLLTFICGLVIFRLSSKFPNFRKYFISIFIFYLLSNTFVYASNLALTQRGENTVVAILNDTAIKTDRLGYVTDYNLGTMVFLMTHDVNSNVLPVSISYPELVKRQEIDKQALFVNIRPIEKSVTEVSSILDKNGLNDYIYLMELRVLDTDPNRVVLKSLKNICAGEDLIFAAPDAMIYHFSDCSN